MFGLVVIGNGEFARAPKVEVGGDPGGGLALGDEGCRAEGDDELFQVILAGGLQQPPPEEAHEPADGDAAGRPQDPVPSCGG